MLIDPVSMVHSEESQQKPAMLLTVLRFDVNLPTEQDVKQTSKQMTSWMSARGVDTSKEIAVSNRWSLKLWLTLHSQKATCKGTGKGREHNRDFFEHELEMRLLSPALRPCNGNELQHLVRSKIPSTFHSRTARRWRCVACLKPR